MTGLRRGPSVVIFTFQLILMVGALALWAVGVNEPLAPDIVLFPATFLAFGAVGAVILHRDRSNPIGRLATLNGLGGSITAVFDSIARLTEPVAGQDWAGWIASCLPADAGGAVAPRPVLSHG